MSANQDEIARCDCCIDDETLVRLIQQDDPIIVECGAHDGRDTQRFLRLWPKCRVICFEPDPRPIERHAPPGFLDRVGKDPRVTLVRAAVAEGSGVATLYRSSGQAPGWPVFDWDHSNSLRRPTWHLRHSPWCRFLPELQIKVPTVSVDEWLQSKPEIGDVDLLWVDIQGGQRAFLAGGRDLLKRAHWLYIECHAMPLYDGEPTQDELCDALDNWEPRGCYEDHNLLFENVKWPSDSPSR